jgi:hypothetical protein
MATVDLQTSSTLRMYIDYHRCGRVLLCSVRILFEVVRILIHLNHKFTRTHARTTYVHYDR